MKKFDPLYDTYLPSENWLSSSENARMNEIQEALNEDPSYAGFVCVEAHDNGHVVLRIEHTIPSNTRGLLLLDLESKLKASIDKGLTIWLEPVGDKSKLRNLRGVTIKS
jgi:hypothetical protein